MKIMRIPSVLSVTALLSIFAFTACDNNNQDYDYGLESDHPVMQSQIPVATDFNPGDERTPAPVDPNYGGLFSEDDLLGIPHPETDLNGESILPPPPPIDEFYTEDEIPAARPQNFPE